MKRLSVTALAACVFVTAGCAIGPDYKRPTLNQDSTWSAPLPQMPPLPHDGKPTNLVAWWTAWKDPALTALLAAAQQENTTIAQAAARIQQARATYTGQSSALFPAFTANASDTRSKGGQAAQFGGPGANDVQRSRNLSLDAVWEFDVVGGARRVREASNRRIDARHADWHDARVSVAAEVATQYVNLRTCEVLLVGYEVDAKSRAQTARLVGLKEAAGFESPANAALSTASSAEANARLVQQRAECDLLVKVLVELTGSREAWMRQTLAPGHAQLPSVKAFAVETVPASAISQRPDVASAELELAASMSEIGVAMADRFPRLSLTGSIGHSSFVGAGIESRGRSWSYGPLISLPIFDAGKRAANVDLARARYDESLASYKAKTLRAVREVEDALVRLDSASRREADSVQALAGYQKFLVAAEARVRVGAGSLPELEEARRSVVAAQGSAVGVTRERLTSWISLYRALGGGWDPATSSLQTASTNSTR
jgi:outer membrane protein, multidrug efflux system